MDKLVLGFMADVLYIKGLIYYDEYEAIMDVKQAEDLQEIVERMLRGDYRGYKKGETYGTII